MPTGPVAAVRSAFKSTPGKIIKGAGSFLFGPSIFLAGAICGAFGKIAAEAANALMSSWVKSVASGVSSLFSNNPFLTWASDASGKLMQGSWKSFAHFYQEGLMTMAQGFEEMANHGGFGGTGIAASALSENDSRDIETMSGEGATAKRLELDSKEFFEMLKEYNQTADETTTKAAIRELSEWAQRTKKLPTELLGKPEAEITAAIKNVEEGFEKAMEKNPALAALVDILDAPGKVLKEAVQKKLDKGETVTPKEIAAAYRELAKSIPQTIAEPKDGTKLDPTQFKAKL